jgi:mannosyltransferase OCH1-like enzyme
MRPSTRDSLSRGLRPSSWAWSLTIVLCWTLCHAFVAKAAATPDWDPQADGMTMTPAPIPSDVDANGLMYFDQTIPRHIHQVWFGDMHRWQRDSSRREQQSTDMWRSYAREFGYGYTLWTEAAIPRLRAMMQPQLQELFDHALWQDNFTLASDIARVVIVANLGGMYFDCDMQPPHTDEGPMMLAEYFPQQGLVLTTERFARSVGNMGVFVANGFMMAPAGHPVLRHMVDHLAAHAWAWADEHGHFEAMYMAGCVPLSRSLAGAFTLIPLDDMYAWNIIHETSANWTTLGLSSANQRD